MAFDIELFKNTLLEECKIAIPKIVADLKHEGIYTIAFYTSGSCWGYIFPTVSTYVGLEEVVAKYAANPSFADESIEQLRHSLKWSPCDSPRHSNYDETLSATWDLLTIASAELYRLYDLEDEAGNQGDSEHDKLVEQLETACLEVLASFDELKLLDGIEDRSTILLNLINGDQDDQERLDRAKRVNPESAYLRYVNDQLPFQG